MEYATGAFPSPRDVRTFAFKPNFSKAPQKVGERWSKENIIHQYKIGKCTSSAVIGHGSRFYGIEMSDDFNYLIQKLEYDDGWFEGSSIHHALKVPTKYGFLPKVEMDKWVTDRDRKGTYQNYIKKLQKIPDKEVERLKTIAAKYKLAGYYLVPYSWEAFKNAIAESEYGILARFELGSEWYTDRNGKDSWEKEAIEPLRRPTNQTFQSGHAVTISNADGGSYRIANSWGETWADEGTAYSMWLTYKPTECWLPVFPETEKEADVEEERRKLEETLRGVLLQLIQKLLSKLNR